MRICAGIGTEVIGVPRAVGDLVDDVRQAEADGFPAAWCVHLSRGIDALSLLAVAAVSTARIDLGVGIVPTYPRHPAALAQQAATVQALAGGRLTLGVGVSHRPAVEGAFGIPYDRPARHMREYLSVLGPLLECGEVKFGGELFKVDCAITVPGTSRVSVVVGALSPLMVKAAGELADGAVTWLVGARGLELDVVPGLRKAAADAGRGAPRLIAGLPVIVCDDPDAGRRRVNQVFARYGTLVNYQQQFEREGVSGPGDVAVVGDERSVEAQLRALASAGATEL
ncbi:MAG: TIGR03564 family F420-dependent LLM class oxidoreductase, partial [Acidimicrobiia bacterium]